MQDIRPQTPSAAFFKLLDQIVTNEQNTKKSFDDAVQIARGQGFTDTEIAMFMHDYLRDKLPARTLSRWTKELKPIEQSTSQPRPLAGNASKKEPEESDTEDSQDDEETENEDEEPQTESGKEAVEKFNEVFPPEQEDITDHPMYQKLQAKYSEKIAESNQWQKKAEQLGEVEGKRSFVSAKDEMNHISGQSTIIMLIMELQKRRNEWKKVKYLVEVVP